MAHEYEKTRYSRTTVKKAGKKYVSSDAKPEEKSEALTIINNWRSAHAYPLQVIYVHLKRIAPKDTIVAQRLKRLYSITHKLSRFPNMSLATMQDIGGCRVVVNTIDDVYSLVNRLKSSRMRHEKKEEYDYIETPKADGYRSYHLVLSYQSDKKYEYNGLFIEVQIRTHLQHMWATAVETMDTFTGNPIKIGRGSIENRHFFLLVSQLFEEYEKKGYSEKAVKNSRVLKALREYSPTKRIIEKLQTTQRVSNFFEIQKSEDYYVLVLDMKNKQLRIMGFPTRRLEEATSIYDSLEKERKEYEDVVLVSTNSFADLQKAYPNYFSDITEFLALLKKMLQ